MDFQLSSINFQKINIFFGASFEAPICSLFMLSNVVDQAVSAVFSAVYNSETATVILIAEGEEIMLQKVHDHQCRCRRSA